MLSPQQNAPTIFAIAAIFSQPENASNLPEEHVDVAPRIGVLPDSRLMALRLGKAERIVCASPAYLGRRGAPETPDDVAGHDCIVYDGFHAPDVWTFARNGTDL